LDIDMAKLDIGMGKLDIDKCKLDIGMGKLDIDMAKLDIGMGKLDLDMCKLDIGMGKLDIDMAKLDVGMGKLDIDIGKLDIGMAKLHISSLHLAPRNCRCMPGRLGCRLGRPSKDGMRRTCRSRWLNCTGSYSGPHPAVRPRRGLPLPGLRCGSIMAPRPRGEVGHLRLGDEPPNRLVRRLPFRPLGEQLRG
jgi:putative membrane protein